MRQLREWTADPAIGGVLHELGFTEPRMRMWLKDFAMAGYERALEGSGRFAPNPDYDQDGT